MIDDEDAVQRLVRFPLEREGYRVLGASSGEDGLRLVEAERPDLVLLDLMLPGMDGIEVCRRLRVLSATLPIIMLTARDDEVDKVLGLEIGADDYVTKPFSLAELRSRVRAVLRRAQRPAGAPGVEDVLEDEGVRLDVARRTAERDGEPVQLTYVEFEILRTLMRSPGRVLSRRALLESVWDSADYREQRTIDVHIRHLREKLERDPSAPRADPHGARRRVPLRRMIRAALQRPGRLRMRLTVVAAASALFALVVLAALVLPSLQHNLEQSRVASLRASVLAALQQLRATLGSGASRHASALQSVAATLGVGAHQRLRGQRHPARSPSPTRRRRGARRSGELVEESATLHRDVSARREPAERAHRGADVLRLQPGHRRRRAGRGAAARRPAAGSTPSSGAS